MGTRNLLALIVPAIVLTTGAATAGARSSHEGEHGNGIHAAREATEDFRQIDNATAAGYGLLKDATGIACIDKPGVGAMGVHYVNGALVGDDVVDATTPEALVYQPGPNGRMRLVALEYVVFQAAWDATHSTPPELFGQTFELVGAGNRYGLDPFFQRHIWLWANNPLGMYEDWNSKVTCRGKGDPA